MNPCSVAGCDRPHYSKGMCKPCYRRDYYLRNGERERENFKTWRGSNLTHLREYRTARDAERFGDDRAERSAALAMRLASSDKTCTRCGETKPKSEYHRDSRRRDGLYSWCRTCFNAHTLDMRDPVAEAARRRAREATPEGRAKKAASVRAWRAANPERWAAWCANDSAAAVERSRKWAEDNPERASLISRKSSNNRRARLAGQSSGPVDYAEILKRHGMTCHICGEAIPSLSNLHMDHVIPLSKGGPHSAENIRPSHAFCNLSKGARQLGAQE